jgi:hypothetical protein
MAMPVFWKSLAAGLLALALLAPAARAEVWSVYGINGNDTGGIIPWSPQIRYTYRDIAALHCAGYKKVARITSVHARYGEYVGFACHFPRGYDPVKGADVLLYTRRPISVLY